MNQSGPRLDVKEHLEENDCCNPGCDNEELS